MSFLIFFTLFGLSVVFPCEGQVKDGDRVVLPPEGLAKVQWQFNVKDIKKVTSRYWYFTSSDGTFDDEFLAQIDGDGTPVIKSKRLAGLKIEKPATLVLKNVNQSYNGSYVFHIVAGSGGSVSKVTVIIAEKPKVIVRCPSTNQVTEGDNFMCLCEGEGGNPAPADVTWYDNNDQPIGTGKGEKLLTLNKVTRTKSGSYKCEAKTHEQAKNETSIKLIVEYEPDIKSFISSPAKPVVGQSVTITCVASAHHRPNYTISLNDTVVSIGNPYIIPEVSKDHGGTYTCNATNALGYDLQNYTLVVGNSPSIFPTTRQGNETADDKSKKKSGPSVGVIVAIVIGVLVLLLLVGGIIYWFKVKSDRTNGGHARVGNDSLGRKPGNSSNQSHEYATLEKPEPVTYAALDKKDLKQGGPEKPARTHTPTVYADIQVA